MTELDWLACEDSTEMLKHVKGKVNDRKLRLFAVACCREIWDRLVDEHSRNAVIVAEKYADGLATRKELEAARVAAWAATRVAAWVAAWAAARVAAWAAARVAAWAAARVAAWAAAWAAARVAARKTQAHILRDIVGNPFQSITAHESWLTPTVLRITHAIYEDKDFESCPILADALEDAGCENEEVLRHLRGKERCRTCWGRGCVYEREMNGDVVLSEGEGGVCPNCKGKGWSQRKTQCVRGCWVLDLLTGRE